MTGRPVSLPQLKITFLFGMALPSAPEITLNYNIDDEVLTAPRLPNSASIPPALFQQLGFRFGWLGGPHWEKSCRDPSQLADAFGRHGYRHLQ